MNAKARLIAHTEAQSTEHLITAMLTLDSKSEVGTAFAGNTPEEVLVIHTIGDVLIARFPKADAKIDEWMDDESPEGLKFITDNSYAALLALAIDQTGNPMLDLSDRFYVDSGSEGGLFVVDADSEFPSEFAGTFPAAESLKEHRNGKHQTRRARTLCRACRETPGMIFPLPHDPAAGFNDPNLSFGKSA
jgi:hypothetical protein